MYYRSTMSEALMIVFAVFAHDSKGQDGNLIKPADGVSVQTVLTDIQSRVDNIQSLTANVEFDEKDDSKKKKKKKKKNDVGEGAGVNPAWPEPPGRDIERGPLMIQRGVGAYLYLERKKDKAEYIANSSTIWKHDIKDKEARHIPASWPVISTFVTNALVMNVFVAMDRDSVKLLGTESVDGEPCWVVEGQSPSRLKMAVGQTKLKFWISQRDGIPRIIRVPKENDAIIRLKDVSINGPVDVARFTFTPPSDVKTKNILGF